MSRAAQHRFEVKGINNNMWPVSAKQHQHAAKVPLFT
jgi:hypothetical protein